MSLQGFVQHASCNTMSRSGSLYHVTDLAAPDPRRRLLVSAALAAVYVVWGSTYLGIRFGVEGGWPPMWMNAVRFLTAGSLLFAVTRLRGVPAPSARQWRHTGAIGALLLVGAVGSVTVAESYGIGSGLTASIVAVMPLWAALVSGLFGNWPRRLEWIGLAIGFAGVAALSQEGDFEATPGGLLLVIAAPIMWGFGSVWSQRLDIARGALGVSVQMLVAGAVFVPAALIRGEPFPAGEVEMSGVLAVVYLALFGSIVAYSAYMYLLATVRPALATSYAYVNPVVAVVLGLTLGSEVVGVWALVGLPLVIAGVAVVVLAQRPDRVRRSPG